MWVAGTQALWPCSIAFPDQQKGSGLEVKQPGLKPAPIRDTDAAGSGFINYARMPAPLFYKFLIRQFTCISITEDLKLNSPFS